MLHFKDLGYAKENINMRQSEQHVSVQSSPVYPFLLYLLLLSKGERIYCMHPYIHKHP